MYQMIIPTILALGRRAIGGISNLRRSPFIGTRTRGSTPMDATTAAKTMGYPAGTQLTAPALARGTALDAGIAGAEGIAVINMLTDEDATPLDYALGGFYGLGAYQFGRRGARQLGMLRRGSRELAPTSPTMRAVELGTIPAIGIDAAFGGPSDPITINPDVTKATPAQQIMLSDQFNDAQKRIASEYFKLYPGGQNMPAEVEKQLETDLLNAATKKPDTAPDAVVSEDMKEMVDPNKENVTVDLKKSPEGAVAEGKKASSHALANNANPTGDRAGFKGYSQFGGPVGEMFDMLAIKDSDYRRSAKLIDEYEELIKTQGDKKKTFEQFKKEYK